MMLSTCVVRRGTGVFTEDPVTREQSEVMAVIYSGICKFRAAGTQAGRAEVPGAVVTDQGATVSLPVGAPGAADVRLDDVWECVTNPFDPSKIGKQARITGGHSQTLATAHRFPVEEVS